MRTLTILLAILLPICASAQAPVSMLPNGNFVGDEDGDGLADHWSYSSGASADKLDVSFGLEEIGPGRFAQRITCTRHEDGHAMLCQVGALAVKQGEWYEVKLRAKGEDLRSASVALHDTDGWKQCGLWRQMSLGKRWREFGFKFEADHDCHETSRFQIWFSSTGTLWVSDVSFVPVAKPPPANIIPDVGHKNLLPNAGFEALGAWGMVNYWTYGWSVAEGRGLDGSNCAAIKWEPDDAEMGYYFDYFEMVERPLVEPYLQAIGYVPLKPGETYTLSASMRCDREGAPAMLGLRGPGAWCDEKVKLSTEWQRFSVSCKAKGDMALVQVGPEFTEEGAEGFGGCTVYIDNAQLEQGGEATQLETRPLEVLVPHWCQARPPGLPAAFRLTPTIISQEAGDAHLKLSVLDFNDAEVATAARDVALKAGANSVPIPVELPGPGFYRVKAQAQFKGHTAEGSARGALCLQTPEATDTAFGMNHAYAYNGFLRLAKQIGISWVRDWSLKWEHVETERGTFTFDKTDFQIQRPQRLGMNVLCMFPFPSAEWSSTAPEELHKTAYPANRIRQAFAPKDPKDLERYVFECVKRYKDQIRVWEVFNESIFTSYSLPKKHGYKPEDYVPLLKAVYEGCKEAGPNCRVMGGYSALPGHHLQLYETMFREGGLKYCDLVSLHSYPGGPPEYLDESLKNLNALMDENGGRKPTWMTEYAYYADDDADPIKRSWPRMLESERQQACWNTRACVIMLANGVQKVFYHIWPTHLNRDSGARIFFEYAGAPRKIAVTQAAMAYFLGSKPVLLKQIEGVGEDAFGYMFEAPEHLRKAGEQDCCITVLWLAYDRGEITGPEGAECFDICGRRLKGDRVPIGEAPVYILTRGLTSEIVAEGMRKALKDAELL